MYSLPQWHLSVNSSGCLSENCRADGPQLPHDGIVRQRPALVQPGVPDEVARLMKMENWMPLGASSAGSLWIH